MAEQLTSAGRLGLGQHAGRAAAIAAVLLSACATPQVTPDTQVQTTPGAGAGYAGTSAGMVVEQRPSTFLSSWHAANWSARSAALTAAGLTAVQLPSLPAAAASTIDIPPGTWCQQVKVLVGGKKQLALFNISGDFAVTPAGQLHCLKIENPSLGAKQVRLDGRPPSCGTGSFTQNAKRSYLYAIPKGVAAGKMITLSAPTFDIAIHYAEECPAVP